MPPNRSQKIVGRLRNSVVFRKKKRRPATIPTAVRNLTRLLRPLVADDDIDPVTILHTALEQVMPPCKTRTRVECALKTLRNLGTSASSAMEEIAFLVHEALQQQRKRPKSNRLESLMKLGPAVTACSPSKLSKPKHSRVNREVVSILETFLTPPEQTKQVGTVIVSDSDNAEQDADHGLPFGDVWGGLLEAASIEITASTNMPKRNYEVYKLASPTLSQSIDQIRELVEKHFVTLYQGRLKGKSLRSYMFSNCRVYATKRSNATYIQMNVGQFEAADDVIRSVSGNKKKQLAQIEFVALVVPGSRFIALTAGRGASRYGLTPIVAFALECALTGSDGTIRPIKTSRRKRPKGMQQLFCSLPNTQYPILTSVQLFCFSLSRVFRERSLLNCCSRLVPSKQELRRDALRAPPGKARQ
jgi:hypothetical protein